MSEYQVKAAAAANAQNATPPRMRRRPSPFLCRVAAAAGVPSGLRLRRRSMVGWLSGGPVVPPGGVRRCCPSPSVGAALSCLPPSVVGRLLQHRLFLGGAVGRRPYFNFAAQMRRQALTRHIQRGWVRSRPPPCPPSLRFADAKAHGRGARCRPRLLRSAR